jgi:glycosyltransferase involved in cell wall biosynthesis
MHNDWSYRTEMGDKGMKRAAEDFSWEKQIKTIYNLIAKNA